MDYKQTHIPVMVNEVLQLLIPRSKGVYVDATLGCAGHAKEILKRLGPEGRLVGIDRDEEAIACAKEILDDPRVFIKKASFSQLKDTLLELNVDKIDGVLFDLGVSMLQLKDYSRGFSFHSEERLDMRMDKTKTLTAWDIINRYSQEKLEKIFKDYGEEPFARRIAREIVKNRLKKTIDTCKELAYLIKKTFPLRGKIHPATRVFQAIRIEVNGEFQELLEGLKQSFELLNAGGRICLISYHSGEDRIVKRFFREKEKEGNFIILTKKPILPSLEEVAKNHSARSARLRGGEKI